LWKEKEEEKYKKHEKKNMDQIQSIIDGFIVPYSLLSALSPPPSTNLNN